MIKNVAQRKGFTLIELLVVIAIIGFLSSVTLTGVNTARQKARDTRRISDLRQMRIALLFYYEDQFERKSTTLVPIPSSGVAYWETSTGNTGNSTTVSCSGGSNWPTTGLRSTLSPTYVSSMLTDPLNGATYCYKYMANPDRQGGCLWTILESNRRVGVIVGDPDLTLVAANPTNYPAGYQCNLDEVMGSSVGDPLSS
jgi:prepilin-type N-terminal cleavage/methylation domain-containing protein